jgi:hypothetical protein
VALERESDEAVEQVLVRDPRRREEARVEARRGEPRDRVELVHHDLAVRLAHEEVRPSHPLARSRDERLERELARPLDLCLRQAGRGDDELRAALVVFRGVVVPVGVQRDDSTGERRDGIWQVAEDADLDLHARDELLDHHLLVVPARELDGRLQLRLLPHLRDAHGGAHVGGLDEHRVAVRVRDRVSQPQRDVSCDRDARAAHQRLEDVLVHAHRRREHTRADVGNSGELAEPLHRSVLAERPMEDRQHDVHRSERRRCRVGRDGKRLRGRRGGQLRAVVALGEGPTAVPSYRDRRHVVAGGVESGRDGRGRAQRDVVLARPPAREHRQPYPAAHGVGVVVVVVVSVGVVSVGVTSGGGT